MKRTILLLILGMALCGSAAGATEIAGTARQVTDLTLRALPGASIWLVLILGMLCVGFAMRRHPSEEAVRIRFE